MRSAGRGARCVSGGARGTRRRARDRAEPASARAAAGDPEPGSGARAPRPPTLEAESARFRLFEAVSTFLRNAANVRPLVLVLDDLHAADEPSLLLLQFLARELADSRLLVVAAYRSVDPIPNDALSAAL